MSLANIADPAPIEAPSISAKVSVNATDVCDRTDSVLEALPAAAADPWIFRDGRKTFSGPDLLSKIGVTLSNPSSDSLVDALIQAGELEAGTADAGHPSRSVTEKVTDAIASALCSRDNSHLLQAHRLLEQVQAPKELSISPPEGFTYYALHPLDFSDIVSELRSDSPVFAVIGIRSIGTTLSAMVTAALKHRGRRAARITVRPTGHPYARHTSFSSEEKCWIAEQRGAGAHFIVVDEGPGRSGSTFLSVAEALLGQGVSREQLTLIGSRQPDPDSLLATNGASRWMEFHFLAVPSRVSTRFTGTLYAGGGSWRELLLPQQQPWPGSWAQMERLKFISSGRDELFKFEGMGRIGSEIKDRAFALAEAGFAPSAKDAGTGFLSYELTRGKNLSVQDLDPSLLEFMARYCAFRANNFRAEKPTGELEEMVKFNLMQEFGLEVKFRQGIFETSNPVFVDGKMQPYEWLVGSPSRFLKTDGTSHGDDHFFPGPCDIAWDLAGLAVEWQMQPNAIQALISGFERLSGETATSDRLPAYMLAYCVFRSAFCKMASQTVCDVPEKLRLHNAYLHYRAALEKNLKTWPMSKPDQS